MKSKLVPPEATVFAKIGEGLKAERLRLTMRPTAIDNNLMAAMPNPEIADSRFLYYLLKTVRLSEWAQGSALPFLRQGDLELIPVIVPSVNEQRRIAGVLGALDDLIETSRRLMVSLDELGMTLFRRSWDGSTTMAIEELGQVTMGQSPPGSTYNEEGLGMVFFQGVRDFGDRYPRSRVFCTAPTRKAATGDILIAVRAPVGETNVSVEETAIGRGVAALRAQQPALALRALRASESTWAAHQGTGTVFSSISGPDLRKARVPKVTDPDLERTLDALDAQHRASALEVDGLTATRDELLPLLLSGAVTVAEVAA